MTKLPTTRQAVSERHAFIRDAYRQNMPVKDIASNTGLAYGSVRVIAHRLGLTRHGVALAGHKRGFYVPAHLEADYQILTRVGHFNKWRAAELLGIVTGRAA